MWLKKEKGIKDYNLEIKYSLTSRLNLSMFGAGAQGEKYKLGGSSIIGDIWWLFDDYLMVIIIIED